MITVDPHGQTPPFEQLKQQIADQVADGRLRPGEKLPTVRALAEQVGLAPNTVARAYRELEAAGVVDTRGRSGTFVAGHEAASEARAAAAAYADRARALGLSDDEAVALLRRAFSAGY